jgi:MFS family permease
MQVTQPRKGFTKAQVATALYAAAVAFLSYASIYAYRKPFTVATFEGVRFWGVSYQTLLIISQGIGYMLSKFYGIKFISELKRLGRWRTSAALIGIAWLAMLVFALVPAPYGMICLLVNGFMLGFMWGIIFSYVEGRRATDFIGSAMAVSFIFAGGFTRSVAVWLRDEWQVPEQWLGFATGLVFLVPLIVFTYLIEKIPPPDVDDVNERTVRLPMNKQNRKALLKTFGLGIVVITITYLFLTIMRDIRDNFMANMWNDLGYGKKPAIFTSTETITSIVVLAMMSCLVIVRNNFRAFQLAHGVVAAGFLLAGISSIMFISGTMSGALWMQLTGLGLYMGYIPFNCIFFERMIASFRIAGNVGFLIYIADAWGYFGSMTVMLSKEILKLQLNWVSFYSSAVIVFALIGTACTILSLVYFNRKYKRGSASWQTDQPSLSAQVS